MGATVTRRDQPISGQNVQKGTRPPKGGVSEAARRLPVKGKTHEAKRKNIQRAVNSLVSLPKRRKRLKRRTSTAPNASKSQRGKTPEAQLAKVAELAAKPKAAAKKSGLKQPKTTKAEQLSDEEKGKSCCAD